MKTWVAGPDEIRDVVENYEPSIDDVARAVVRGTKGAITEISGADTVTALELRQRARRLQKQRQRRAKRREETR